MNWEALWGIDSWVPECLIAGGAWPGNSPLEPQGSSAAVGASISPSGSYPLGFVNFKECKLYKAFLDLDWFEFFTKSPICRFMVKLEAHCEKDLFAV